MWNWGGWLLLLLWSWHDQESTDSFTRSMGVTLRANNVNSQLRVAVAPEVELTGRLLMGRLVCMPYNTNPKLLCDATIGVCWIEST